MSRGEALFEGNSGLDSAFAGRGENGEPGVVDGVSGLRLSPEHSHIYFAVSGCEFFWRIVIAFTTAFGFFC